MGLLRWEDGADCNGDGAGGAGGVTGQGWGLRLCRREMSGDGEGINW